MSLNYEVQVVHPTFNGQRIVRWDVIIPYIEKREIKTITLESQNGDDNVINRESFRGSASTGTWVGNKTFFVDQCVEMLDLANGKIYRGEAEISARLSDVVLEHERQAKEKRR